MKQLRSKDAESQLLIQALQKAREEDQLVKQAADALQAENEAMRKQGQEAVEVLA